MPSSARRRVRAASSAGTVGEARHHRRRGDPEQSLVPVEEATLPRCRPCRGRRRQEATGVAVDPAGRLPARPSTVENWPGGTELIQLQRGHHALLPAGAVVTPARGGNRTVPMRTTSGETGHAAFDGHPSPHSKPGGLPPHPTERMFDNG